MAENIFDLIRSGVAVSAAGAPIPATVVVSGGRAGVGATTIALQIAAALAQEALRVVVVDANLSQPDIAARCNVGSGLGIHDVLAGAKSIHEVLQLGPAGIQILAGDASDRPQSSINVRSIQRLLKQTRSLAPHADWLVVDAGHEACEMTAQWWAGAGRLLIVTSPEAAAVMDSYALLKTLLSRRAIQHQPLLLVNQAADEATARDVHRRIDQSCRRFLNLAIEFAGWLPLDPRMKLIAITAAMLAPQVLEVVQRLHDQQPSAHSAAA